MVGRGYHPGAAQLATRQPGTYDRRPARGFWSRRVGHSRPVHDHRQMLAENEAIIDLDDWPARIADGQQAPAAFERPQTVIERRRTHIIHHTVHALLDSELVERVCPPTPNIAPDAHIRFYHDAHIAEATSFNVGQGCTRTAHPSYPPRQMLQLAWRRNRALDRWLDYLLKQGHSVATLKPATRSICEKTGVAMLVEMG